MWQTISSGATVGATVQDMESGTEAVLRAQIRVILGFGVTQRALADRLLVSETWLSRWLKQPPGVKYRAITVPEMDRFRAYVREFRQSLEESQRSEHSDAAGSLPRNGTADKP